MIVWIFSKKNVKPSTSVKKTTSTMISTNYYWRQQCVYTCTVYSRTTKSHRFLRARGYEYSIVYVACTIRVKYTLAYTTIDERISTVCSQEFPGHIAKRPLFDVSLPYSVVARALAERKRNEIFRRGPSLFHGPRRITRDNWGGPARTSVLTLETRTSKSRLPRRTLSRSFI